MKKEYIVLAIFAVALIVLAACTAAPSTSLTIATTTPSANMAVPATPIAGSTDVTIVDDNGNTMIDSSTLGDSLSEIPFDTLSTSEADGILYMREEEKLARDVYLTLYEQWEVPIFKNISDSEATHMEAVETLIDRYELQDPAADSQVGEFANQTLQELYNQLTSEGSLSLAAALQVGAAIEEIDIIDLEEYLAQTEKADIAIVYENLMKGSRNHLRSFVSTLERREGETYQPQYLSQAAYEAIVNTPAERGRQG